MALTFYYGSGSPYAWKVHLALEHKALPYERKVLSFSAGDTRKPEFVALNPRHRVPTIVDGDFVLYESSAIVEYLEDAYPGRGAPLFPAAVRERAVVRRLICEMAWPPGLAGKKKKKKKKTLSLSLSCSFIGRHLAHHLPSTFSHAT